MVKDITTLSIMVEITLAVEGAWGASAVAAAEVTVVADIAKRTVC